MPGYVRGPERALIETDFLRFVEGEFTMPDGFVAVRQIVRHPGAVAVLAIDGDDVVLLRQYRAPLDAEVLEIPAGKRDVAGEAPEVTARRELAEETGLAAASLELLTTFVNSPGFCDEITHLYLATGLTSVERDVQSAEEAHMTIERLPFGVALAAVRSGEITDAKTIIAMLLADGRRG